MVVLGTLFALGFLMRSPDRLISWLPSMLTIYFFIPAFTFITMWQTVPLMLMGRAGLRGKFRIGGHAIFMVMVIFLSVASSFVSAMLFGSDHTRAVVRLLYYAGILGLISYGFEMGRREHAYSLLLKGFALLGAVLAFYALYQILASYLGLPFRGILRGTLRAAEAFEAGFPRVNSLASEPKRLGYVLCLSGISCFFLARISGGRSRKLDILGFSIIIVSAFTFSASYFMAVFLSILVVIPLYGRKGLFIVGLACAGVALLFMIMPNSQFVEAIADGYSRRLEEVEVGIDGKFVYRQEFFAWDYLYNQPRNLLFGVGLGQYYSELNSIYGTGVGINEYGGFEPINSNALELLIELGVFVTVLIYGSVALLILKLRRWREDFVCIALILIAMQSFSILTMYFMALFVGFGSGRLKLKRDQRRLVTSGLWTGKPSAPRVMSASM